MTGNAIHLIDRFKSRYMGETGHVLEVGSYHLNGHYSGRSLWQLPGWAYTGADIKIGPNVDTILPANGVWDGGDIIGFPSGGYDLVVSVDCFEHVTKPWNLIHSMASVLLPGGLVFIATPFAFHLHRHPLDTFRYGEDGLRSLCEGVGLEVLQAGMHRFSLRHEIGKNWVVWLPLLFLRTGIWPIESWIVARRP